MMRYVGARYPSWSEEISRVALGVALMSLTKDITAQDQVHYLHLAQGGIYLRSRPVQTFLYGNGSFRLFNGVMPESVLQRCREYASYVEGCLWCIEKNCSGRNEADIFEELGRVFRAITSHVRASCGGDANNSSDDVAGDPRGEKRKRPWLTMEESDIQPSSDVLSDLDIFEALMCLSLWESGSRSEDSATPMERRGPRKKLSTAKRCGGSYPQRSKQETLYRFMRSIWTARR